MRVPDGKGIHAVEPVRERLPPMQVSAQDDLGVTGGREDLALGDELLAQLFEVVGLTAVDHDDVAPWSVYRHRLGATGDVNHRQTTVAERCIAIRPAI